MNVMESEYKTDDNKSVYLMNSLGTKQKFKYGLFEIRANLKYVSAHAGISLEPFDTEPAMEPLNTMKL